MARHIGRHGTASVAKVAFVSAVTHIMGASPTHPNGVPEAVFDTLRQASLDNHAPLCSKKRRGLQDRPDTPASSRAELGEGRQSLEGPCSGASGSNTKRMPRV